MDSLIFPVLLALLAGFMFLSIRKQKKRVAEMQNLRDSVQTGARIQLSSGLFGTVVDGSADETVDVEIAAGVITRWNRLAIMRVVPTEEAAATYPSALGFDPSSLPGAADDQPGPVTLDKLDSTDDTFGAGQDRSADPDGAQPRDADAPLSESGRDTPDTDK